MYKFYVYTFLMSSKATNCYISNKNEHNQKMNFDVYFRKWCWFYVYKEITTFFNVLENGDLQRYIYIYI